MAIVTLANIGTKLKKVWIKLEVCISNFFDWINSNFIKFKNLKFEKKSKFEIQF